MRIAVLIRSLGSGGAERQLVALARGLAGKGHDMLVITFYDNGVFDQELETQGIARATIHKRGRWDIIGSAWRLARILKSKKMDVLYSSMPAANLMSVLARALGARQPVAWRLAASDMDMAEYDWFSAAAYRLEGWCARMPDVIVANSQAGARAAKERGYPGHRLRVVHNGIDTNLFAPDREAGAALIGDWGLDPEKRRIGMVARGDPKKGHGHFLEAVRLFRHHREDVEFVCVGVESADRVRELRERARQLGVADCVAWRGFEKDITAAYNAMDLTTLPSRFGEGFPNAVGESMACGVPCVATNTGDSALVVGDAGEVVARGSPRALMDGWLRLLGRLEENETGLRNRARSRIIENFGVEVYVDTTEQLLRNIA